MTAKILLQAICTSRKENNLKSNVFIFIDLCVFLQSEQNIVASFDRKGEYIYTGNSKGKVSTRFKLQLDFVAKVGLWYMYMYVCGGILVLEGRGGEW